ncbi:alpha-glucuronidase [Saonia flava]|uniref:Xylan alpha-1,2-glucuronidase n=1 Tax=Saonia flava TaxID=523696 RepID=A0A846R2Q4_9FLAO|nr:alpha-glucuronidase family glycosyl hydrolase [Saonia flava]NJB72235.1 alpha-glucuronidase [Saonia flava]
MKQKKYLLLFIAFLQLSFFTYASNGYDLWLGYRQIENENLLNEYVNTLSYIHLEGDSETLKVTKKELIKGLMAMLGKNVPFKNLENSTNSLIVANSKKLSSSILEKVNDDLKELNKDGFIIKTIRIGKNKHTVITSNDDVGVLYGVFNFLRLMQQNKSITNLSIVDSPKLDVRMLNHWDNMDRTVERGFAGFSLWNWHTLPDYIDQRYIDYARANASIGINGTALTNVNANALVLTPHYLEKVKALADVFRPYGIKVYLTARFSAPIEIGGLDTADPLNADVQEWWNNKTKEIYDLIPDFGGFLVKANSEGQPGPQNYNRNHVDGANMMAKSLAPYKGIVMWRAFVYSEHDSTDRAKQAYSEFVPYDGQFLDNVIVQVKNGAIDFQPREPFHPMFGAMPKTPLMMEFQITKEYLGFATHLAFLPKLYEEVLSADTYRKGKGSTVAKVIDGSLHNKKLTGMAGVSNIGNDINWTGHPFGQADWYGFGRLAWNPHLSAESIADEWIRSTFSNDEKFIGPVKKMMLESREMVVNYMNPLGLHHIFDTGHHYGPGPWVGNLSRPEWNPVYYHKADENGIGFDRTETGSNALEQYAPELAAMWGNLDTCPEIDLLWFHHLAWDYTLKDGNTLWDGMALKYQKGVDDVQNMVTTWEAMKPYIDSQRHNQVSMLLKIQLKEAKWWRNACMLYFQTFSKMDFPEGMEKPDKTLEHYKSLKFPFAPGIRPRW